MNLKRGLIRTINVTIGNPVVAGTRAVASVTVNPWKREENKTSVSAMYRDIRTVEQIVKDDLDAEAQAEKLAKLAQELENKTTVVVTD